MASTHKHIRSSTANKRPTTAIADGQIALNTNSASPGLFFKDSTGATIIKIGPVHVGATAPNASPAAGGSAGNSTGEIWLDNSLTPVGVKIWNGSAWVNATPIGSTTVQGLLELATDAETQAGSDNARAVTPASLQSKVSDSTSTTSSTTIASSTAVKAAYDLANAALPKTGGTITGNLEIGTTGSLSFEGSTADGFETTIAVVDPTADRTITLPNTTGTVVTTGDTGTVTSTMLADGTIVDADINSAAAIAHSKLASLTSANILLGNASNVATSTAVTGDVTISNTGVTAIASGVIVDADINASAAIADTKLATISTAGKVNGTALTGTIPSAVLGNSSTFVGTTSIALNRSSANQALTGISSVALPGSTSGTVTVQPTAIAGTTTITLPATTGTVVTTGDSGTVTSTMIADGTIVNGDINASAAIAGTKISPDFGSQTVQTTGIFSHALGTAAAPTVTFTGDTNTGIYSPGADQVAISTNGANRFQIDSSGNITVDTNTFYVDAANNRVGVGTTSPATNLEVRGGGAGVDAITTISSIQNGAFVRFAPAGSNTIRQYTIGSAVGGALSFYDDTAGSERLRIDSSGRVGIGTSSPTNTAGFSQQLQLSGNLPCISIDNTGTGANKYSLGVNASGAFGIWDNTVSGYRMYINSSGLVGIGVTSPGSILDINGPITLRSSGTVRGYIGDVDGVSNIQLRSETQTIFKIVNDEAARIDASRRLLVGTSSAFDSAYTGTNGLAYIEKSSTFSSLGVKTNSADTNGAYITLGKARGGTANSKTIVNNGDEIGGIYFEGADGAAMRVGANISAYVDGTPGASDLPTRLVFSTTADGASSPTERMRISQTGDVSIAKTSNDPTVGTGIVLGYAGGTAGALFCTKAETANTSTTLGVYSTGASAYRFYVGMGGAVYATSTTITGISDARLKENVRDLEDGLDKVLQLQPRKFDWKAGKGKDTKDDRGFIAQEFEQVFPDLVEEWKDPAPEGEDPYKAVRADLIPVLVKAIQEQQVMIAELQAEVAALKAQ